jgi:hypothetical protein
MRSLTSRLGIAAVVAGLIGSVTATTAVAEAPDPLDMVLPAGQACAGFDLRIEGTGGDVHTKEIRNRSGVVPTFTAGVGQALTFTNLATGTHISLPSNGFTQTDLLNPDGTHTVDLTGHNVVILFPTDVPAGPSTTLHIGRVVYTYDASGVFTVRSVSGRSVDLCAAVTP